MAADWGCSCWWLLSCWSCGPLSRIPFRTWILLLLPVSALTHMFINLGDSATAASSATPFSITKTSSWFLFFFTKGPKGNERDKIGIDKCFFFLLLFCLSYIDIYKMGFFSVLSTCGHLFKGKRSTRDENYSQWEIELSGQLSVRYRLSEILTVRSIRWIDGYIIVYITFFESHVSKLCTDSFKLYQILYSPTVLRGCSCTRNVIKCSTGLYARNADIRTSSSSICYHYSIYSDYGRSWIMLMILIRLISASRNPTTCHRLTFSHRNTIVIKSSIFIYIRECYGTYLVMTDRRFVTRYISFPMVP